MNMLTRLILVFLLLLGMGVGMLPGRGMAAPLGNLAPTDVVTVLSGGTLPGLAAVTGDPTTGSCVSKAESFLKFNLSGATGTVSGALLTLTSTWPAVGDQPGVTLTMGLYGSTDTISWSESSIAWATRPTPTTGLLSSASQTLAGGSVVFPTSAALDNFLNAQRQASSKAATLIIIPIACTALVGTADQAMNTPVLGPVPTAVTMSTFRAADPAVNWPLIAGLGVLAAVVIGGLAVTRKRAAGR